MNGFFMVVILNAKPKFSHIQKIRAAQKNPKLSEVAIIKTYPKLPYT